LRHLRWWLFGGSGGLRSVFRFPPLGSSLFPEPGSSLGSCLFVRILPAPFCSSFLFSSDLACGVRRQIPRSLCGSRVASPADLA
jgi:hypothetical protein